MGKWVIVFVLLVTPATAQPLTSLERDQIDQGVLAVLSATGAPSASIAIVRGGEIVYEHAYGDSRSSPTKAADPSMRYAIGSVSKQFTATAVLLLAEDGRLSLDDKVARWFPELTSANEVTLRQVLSMTSGYQDYWPQDYVIPDMQSPATAPAIIQRWATKPLDFEPGTTWQYSNTNYLIAAAIVERVAGMRLMDFLTRRVFLPLAMTSVTNFDAGPLSTDDAAAYLRNALGPLRPAPKEAAGWLFGAGQLAMTARDLARWDLSVINQSVLRPASYRTQQTEVLLTAGNTTGYGLGVFIGAPGGRRRISHGGAVSGYTTTNNVYPDDRAAIVVFTNIYPGASGAADHIAERIANVIFASTDRDADRARELARQIYDGLAQGILDRTRLTRAAGAYFTPEVLSDFAKSLALLGSPTMFVATGDALRGGMHVRSYRIRAGNVLMTLTTITMPDGQIEQYILSRAS
jgi:CubicO group peptidase (beta-lactamase class C family)